MQRITGCDASRGLLQSPAMGPLRTLKGNLGALARRGDSQDPVRLAQCGSSEGGHFSEQYTRQVSAGRAPVPPNLLPRFG
jgi:hypothetical protein